MKKSNLIILATIMMFIIACSPKEELKVYDYVDVKELVFPPYSNKSGEPMIYINISKTFLIIAL